jgi:hypothetical protein
MAKSKRKAKPKPKEDKQTMDGLDVSFEEAMKVLSQPVKREDKK